MHDVTGALTLVMSDEKWTRMSVNVTNPIDVATANQRLIAIAPPTLCAQITLAMPLLRLRSTSTAWRQRGTTHKDFSFASSSLTTVLLASLGEANKDTLRTTVPFPDLAPYMLDPRQIASSTPCLPSTV